MTPDTNSQKSRKVAVLGPMPRDQIVTDDGDEGPLVPFDEDGIISRFEGWGASRNSTGTSTRRNTGASHEIRARIPGDVRELRPGDRAVFELSRGRAPQRPAGE